MVSKKTILNSIACKNIDFLKLLTKYSGKIKKFKSLLKNATPAQVDSISEIILNYLSGHLNLNVEKYRKHSKLLRFIADNSKTCKKRRQKILSRGHGIITPLIALAIPVLMKMLK